MNRAKTAKSLIKEVEEFFRSDDEGMYIAQLMSDLRDVVDAAQNGPPQGAGDETLDKDTWIKARDIAVAFEGFMRNLNRALR
jgi:hypothetical protein